MNSGSIPIVKFMFDQEISVFNETLSINPTYEAKSIHQADELANFLTTVPSVLIIAYLQNKEHFAQIATFMKMARQASKNSVYKIVVFNYSGDNKFSKAISKLGIQDQIEPRINCKGLKFKIDFWMKSLRVQERALPQSTGATWLEPLTLEDDIWILKSELDCKKILNRWLVKLMGPGPVVAQWNEIKNNLWRFDFKENEKEMFIGGKGSWYFYGESKPDFIWKENSWLITGDNFELFYKDEDETFSRLLCRNKLLKICKNSLFAQTKESLIIEQLEKKLVFKKEAQKLNDLEGKGSTNYLDNISSGEIEGTSSEANYWKNNNSYQSESGEGNLSGRIDQAKAIDGYYRGHDKDSEKETAEKEKERTDIDKRTRDKNQEEFKNRADHLDGFYRGDDKNPEKEAVKKEKERTENHKRTQDKSPEESKSRADHLDGFYRGDDKHSEKKAVEKEKERKENHKRTQDKGHEESKSQTDHLDGFYRSHEKESQEEATEEEKALLHKLSRIQKERKNNSSDEQLEKAEAILQRKLKAVRAKTKLKLVPTSDDDKKLEEVIANSRVSSFLFLNNKKITCELNDYYDETIIFTTSDKEIKIQEMIKINMNFNDSKKDSEVDLEGNVLSVDTDYEGMSYVIIQINKKNVREVAEFMKLFEDRQNNINHFFKQAKGF